ncbi:MAG: peptidylprolyl isomerase [Bacteroidales bacterium]|nr:peptidylprolyl isomerase [Bacteroidales bacterium]
MKKITKVFLAALLISVFNFQFSISQAQKKDNPVVFEINGKKIYKSEFMKEFLRSIGKDESEAPTACTYEKRQALEDYAELFVNYRTKLEDAFVLGYDTMPEMLKELNGYRNELAAPYLIDSVTLNTILKEAYERNKYLLHAAHILVKLGKQPTPADTLNAYKKAMEYYERVKGGENFYSVAVESLRERLKTEQMLEDDPRKKDNGDLGYFSVFDMVYPFETAAYNLNVGEVSLPVRSNYGYHIVKLIEKEPYFNKCTFQHIWVSQSADPKQSEARIKEAFDKIKNGENFGTVCRDYTDDNSTADRGGMISDAMFRQIPQEYVSWLSKMAEGDVSMPSQTQYGWHMLRLIKRDTLASFEDMVPYYKQRLVRDSRSNKPREAFVEQCKTKYNFVDYTKMYMKQPKGKKPSKVRTPLASLDECRAALSDSVFSRSWSYDESKLTDLRPLFSVEDREYTAKDLMKFIYNHQRAEMPFSLDMYLENRYQNFINDKVFEYADQHLEEEHNEFAALMDEYRNGLMIFSYNDNMIWSKAIRDTAGLAQFYKTYSAKRDINNEADAPFFWNERADVTIVSVSDSVTITPDKVVKILNKATKKGWSNVEISDAINAKIKGDANFTVKNMPLLEKDHQNTLKNGQWRKGVYVNPASRGYEVVRVDKLYDPCLKSQSEARGYYVNEYQTYLEKELIKKLRKQYNVVIHQDVIDEITY